MLFVGVWGITCVPIGLAAMAGMVAEDTTSRLVRRDTLREQLTDGTGVAAPILRRYRTSRRWIGAQELPR